jgi:Predicted membrane protein
MIQMLLKAFFIGATMMVPGVSGGSMAMVLSVYEELITRLSSFRRNVKGNFVYLALFTVSALAGILLIAKPIKNLIVSYPVVSMYFFMGLVIGSVPATYRESGIKKIGWKNVISFAIGILIVLLIALVPASSFNYGSKTISSMALEALIGFLVSAGFILPGISFSYLLLVLGMYSFIMDSVSSFDILSLLPFGIGFILGVLVIVKLIDKALKAKPEISYSVILGFLLGSLVPVFPGIPTSVSDSFVALSLFIAGFAAVYSLSRFNVRKQSCV